MTPDVIRVDGSDQTALIHLLSEYGLTLNWIARDAPIPGSYWGDPEAGLIGSHLYARPDTPLHSILHEAAHYICMDTTRRLTLDTNAGGDDLEECAVCYLQVMLADQLPHYSRTQLFSDMDAWGYSFRLGSARGWFSHDAEDARAWLAGHGIITPTGQLSEIEQ